VDNVGKAAVAEFIGTFALIFFGAGAIIMTGGQDLVAIALAHGLATGDRALLQIALDDVLHVPYRRTLVPGLASLHDAARAAGAYGATLSGSGPTLVAIATQDVAERVADAMKRRWSAEGVVAESFVQRRPAVVG